MYSQELLRLGLIGRSNMKHCLALYLPVRANGSNVVYNMELLFSHRHLHVQKNC